MSLAGHHEHATGRAGDADPDGLVDRVQRVDRPDERREVQPTRTHVLQQDRERDVLGGSGSGGDARPGDGVPHDVDL